MVKKLEPDTIEAVYAVILKKEQMLKSDLAKSLDGINDELLSDILFYLKLRRGVIVKRNWGIFRDYETYQKFSRR